MMAFFQDFSLVLEVLSNKFLIASYIICLLILFFSQSIAKPTRSPVLKMKKTTVTKVELPSQKEAKKAPAEEVVADDYI